MANQWLRRGWVLAASAAALLLGACGGGDVASQFTPARIVAFGDGFADLGQNGARYTVNDGSVNNWTQFLAAGYGRPLATSASGGTSYAIGNARISADPDAAGNPATRTVVEQVDAFLAAGAPRSEDLLILNAGTSDVIVQARSVIDAPAATQAQALEQALTAAGQAGRELGAQVRRLVNAGAKRVVVVGPYNLGRSAWAVEPAVRREAMMEALSSRFNEQMQVSIFDLGENVLYVDAAYFFNLVTFTPASYDLVNGTARACTSIDPGPGIGTGAGQVNSNLCNASTIATGVNYAFYVFADRVYPTPRAHQLFGDYALGRIRDRW